MATTNSKKSKLYSICKSLVSIFLTFLLMLPIIYLIGIDESFHNNRPLYSAYTKDKYFQEKIAEVQTALNTTNIVNIFVTAEKEEKISQVNDWENLRQFKEYVGFYLNSKSYKTLDRSIIPPLILSKKGKKSNPADNQKLLQAAYSLSSDGQITFLSNHLGKFASNTISRLKLRVKQSKQATFTEKIKNNLINQFIEGKIWMITIDAGSWQNHSSEELKKQVNAILKQRPNDKFVIFSVGSIDPNWKKVKNISFRIDQGVLGNIKNSLNEVVKSYLAFKINATKFVQTALCSSKISLLRLNNFINSCNSTFSCYKSIQILSDSKNNKEYNGKLRPYLQELCDKGRISEDNQEIFLEIINDLGFYDQELTQDLQQQIKVYYQIGANKYCKGLQRCNFKWLNPEAKIVKVKQTITSQKTVKQSVKPSKDAIETPKQEEVKIVEDTKVSVNEKNKNEKKLKETVKEVKQKSSKQSKKPAIQQINKQVQEDIKKQSKKSKDSTTKSSKKEKESKRSVKINEKQPSKIKNKNKVKVNKQEGQTENDLKKDQKKIDQDQTTLQNTQKQDIVIQTQQQVSQIVNQSSQDKNQEAKQINEDSGQSKEILSESSQIETNEESTEQIQQSIQQEEKIQTLQNTQQQKPTESLQEKTEEAINQQEIIQVNDNQKAADTVQETQQQKPLQTIEQATLQEAKDEDNAVQLISNQQNKQQINVQNEQSTQTEITEIKTDQNEQETQIEEELNEQNHIQDQKDEEKNEKQVEQEQSSQTTSSSIKTNEYHDQTVAQSSKQEIKEQELPEENINTLNIQNAQNSETTVEQTE